MMLLFTCISHKHTHLPCAMFSSGTGEVVTTCSPVIACADGNRLLLAAVCWVLSLATFDGGPRTSCNRYWGGGIPQLGRTEPCAATSLQNNKQRQFVADRKDVTRLEKHQRRVLHFLQTDVNPAPFHEEPVLSLRPSAPSSAALMPNL